MENLHKTYTSSFYYVQKMVGLAVTDDFDTGQSQPAIEEVKLAELAGSNSQSGNKFNPKKEKKNP